MKDPTVHNRPRPTQPPVAATEWAHNEASLERHQSALVALLVELGLPEPATYLTPRAAMVSWPGRAGHPELTVTPTGQVTVWIDEDPDPSFHITAARHVLARTIPTMAARLCA